MGFELVDYKVLTVSINHSIIRTLDAHHILQKHKLQASDTIDSTKLKELALDQKDAGRRIQVMYLLTTMDLLEQSKEMSNDQKARILNAAAYYVVAQIKESYKGYISSNPESSTLYSTLITALGITKNNAPKENDLIDMYGPLAQFMQQIVFKNGDSRQGFNDKHAYDSDEYDVCDDICDLIKKTSEYRIQSIKAEDTKLHKATSGKTQKSKFPSIWSSSATAPAAAASATKGRAPGGF